MQGPSKTSNYLAKASPTNPDQSRDRGMDQCIRRSCKALPRHLTIWARRPLPMPTSHHIWERISALGYHARAWPPPSMNGCLGNAHVNDLRVHAAVPLTDLTQIICAPLLSSGLFALLCLTMAPPLGDHIYMHAVNVYMRVV